MSPDAGVRPPDSPDPDVDRCLTFIRQASEAMAAEVEARSPEDWARPTTCPPWLVRDLAVHVVASGEMFVIAVGRGLAGVVEPNPDTAGRARRQAELEQAGPARVAEALRAATDAFEGLYRDLTEDQLSALCYHRRGNRPVSWYAAHRLAEVAFHAFDLQASLGREPHLGESVAALLLPTLLESNAPRVYAAAATGERGAGERYLLRVTGDRPAQWRVRIDPDQLVVERTDPEERVGEAAVPGQGAGQGGDGPADLAITATAENMALLVYGRRDLGPPSPSSAYRLDGDESLVSRFAVTFPRP